MPDFPILKSQRGRGEYQRYDSRANLTTQQTSFLAPEDNTGQVLMEVGNKIGQQLTNIGTQWASAIDEMQKATIEANQDIGIAKIKSKYESDPSFSKPEQLEEAYKELDNFTKENSGGFSNKATQAQMQLKLQRDTEIAKIQLQNVWKKNQISNTQIAVQQRLDLAAQQGDVEKIKNTISAYGNNIFGKKQAYELEKEYVKKAKFSAFVNDLENDPTNANKKLEKNSYEFDIKELNSAKEILKKKSQENEQANELEQFNTSVQLAQQAASGASEADMMSALDSARINKKIPQSVYDAFSKSVRQPNSNKSDPAVEEDLYEKYLKASLSGDNAKITDFLIDTLNNKKVLDSERFNYFLNRTNPEYLELQKPKAKEMWAGFKFIKNFAKATLDSRLWEVRLFKQFMTESQGPTVQASAVPKIARDIVRAEALRQNPDLIGKEDLTNLSMTRKSGIKAVYPGDTNIRADFKGKIKPPDPATLKLNDVTEINGIYYRVTGEDPNADDYLEKLDA